MLDVYIASYPGLSMFLNIHEINWEVLVDRDQVHGRVGRDMQPLHKPHRIRSPDRPGLTDFSCVYVEKHGYEATRGIDKIWHMYYNIIMESLWDIISLCTAICCEFTTKW